MTRIQAAVDARDEGADILILARTDAAATRGIDEAIGRAKEFVEIGADIIFVEVPALEGCTQEFRRPCTQAPQTEAEMQRFCDEVAGPKLANMIEVGDTFLRMLPLTLRSLNLTLIHLAPPRVAKLPFSLPPGWQKWDLRLLRTR